VRRHLIALLSAVALLAVAAATHGAVRGGPPGNAF
jgi:putative copper export protein